MKRVFVRMLVSMLLLAMIVPLSAFAQKKMTITLWTKEGEGEEGLGGETIYGEIVNLTKKFSQTHPGGVEFEVVSYGVEDLRQNFQSAAFAGAGPDLLWTVSDHAGPFEAMKLIKPVDEVSTKRT